jgi:hypothetical protein
LRRRCNAKIPQRLDFAPALRVNLDETDKVRNNLYANDRPQRPTLCRICRRDNIQEENAERDSAKETCDDRKQLDTSDGQLEDGLLSIWSQGIEMPS